MTPGKTRKRHASVTEPDEAAKNQIVEVIYDFKKSKKRMTLKILRDHLKQQTHKEKGAVIFDGSAESLRRTLYKLGFTHAFDNGTLYLRETPRIQLLRTARTSTRK